MNRWSHGYAYEYMRPWGAFWPDGPLPIEAARRGWGRVAVAGADSGAFAYAHSAIDQAVRAVRELLGTPPGAPDHARCSGPPPERIGLWPSPRRGVEEGLTGGRVARECLPID